MRIAYPQLPTAAAPHLPAARWRTADEPRSPGASPGLAGLRVVIVEDEGITQLQLRKMLMQEGLTVAGTASNGERAVELVLATQPDIVLMDIKMPGPVDGLEAARRILPRFPTCIIFLTAYVDLAVDAQQIGACGYIVKPIDSVTLLPQVRAAYQAYNQNRP